MILSGTNSYSGATEVLAGTLYLTNSEALPGGTSLTVAAGGALIFDPSITAAPGETTSGAATPRAVVAAVPEPGTLALWAAGALMAALGGMPSRGRQGLGAAGKSPFGRG